MTIVELLCCNYTLLAAASLVIGYFIYHALFDKKINLPPGPKGLPLLGTVEPLDRALLWNHKDLFGDVSSIKLFGTNIVVLNSVEAIHDAFQSPKHAEFLNGRPEIFYGKYVHFPDVIFRSPHDDKWSKQRQAISTILTAHGEKATDIEQVISDELEVVKAFLLEKAHPWNPARKSDKDTSTGVEFDIIDVLTPSLMNILIILLIGKRVEYGHEIMSLVKDLFDVGAPLMDPANNFILMKFPFLRHLPFGFGSRYRRSVELFRRMLWFLFDEPKKNFKLNDEECQGVVYELLRKQQTSPWMTDELIKGIVQDVFGGGNTTTRYTLYSLFLVLLHYPDVQSNIQSEIEEVIGCDRKPSISDRKSMPYTEATILEILRYATVSPLGLAHISTGETDFRGYTIPKDTMIIANMWRVHNGDTWDKPESFNPSRFLDDDGCLLPATHAIRKKALPFGVGKRHCIGEVFARNRLFLYITNILQRFTLKPASELPSCDPWTFFCDFNLYPAPYKLRVEDRRA